MLVDRAIIEVSGGKGGDGAVAFRREKFVPKGGPDGGDGGRGGSVYLTASNNISTLLDMNQRRHWHAEDGRDGQSKNKFGASGKDLTIQLPAGTLVYDDETGALLDDLDEDGKTLLAASGGKGGYGNTHFKSATNQTPNTATQGEPGQMKRLRLELKLIADVGFVGLPNAGKSTLLARLSRAKPKIADYPFTTLEPQLGIAQLPGHRRIILADIPGLIEGASKGTGLGHEFLRHIERTRILVHLIEPMPSDESDPIENFRTIQNELRNYSEELASKQTIVAVNKTDLFTNDSNTSRDREGAGHIPQQTLDSLLRKLEMELGTKVVPLSAATGDGCRELLEQCWGMLHDRGDRSIEM